MAKGIARQLDMLFDAQGSVGWQHVTTCLTTRCDATAPSTPAAHTNTHLLCGAAKALLGCCYCNRWAAGYTACLRVCTSRSHNAQTQFEIHQGWWSPTAWQHMTPPCVRSRASLTCGLLLYAHGSLTAACVLQMEACMLCCVCRGEAREMERLRLLLCGVCSDLRCCWARGVFNCLQSSKQSN